MNSEIKAQILSIANASDIDDTIVDFVQSRDIARLMMDKPCFGILNFVGKGKPLNQVIAFIKKAQEKVPESIPDKKTESIPDKKTESSPFASLAFHVAEATAKNATCEEDVKRAEREKNAAIALSKGDIGNAFASLNYFLDR